AGLDQAGAGSRQAQQDLLRRGVVRIAGRDERHQRLAPLLSERAEASIDTQVLGHEFEAVGNRQLAVEMPIAYCLLPTASFHIFIPKWPATAKMSLSPRPHMFMTRRLSRASVGASFSTKASACAGSSAGMMPSSRVHSWKAASASLSVM